MNLKEKARKAEEARLKAEAEATAEKLKECMVKLTAKAGSGGKLFGAVTTKEISEGSRSSSEWTSQAEAGFGGAHQGLWQLSGESKAGL